MATTQILESTHALRESVLNAVGSVVSALEPQLNEFASKATTQAIDKGRDLAQLSYRAVKRQPWYLVGVAAFLLIGTALIFGMGARETMDDVAP